MALNRVAKIGYCVGGSFPTVPYASTEPRQPPLVESLIEYLISIRLLHLPRDHHLTSQMECHWAGVEGADVKRDVRLYISTQQSAIGEEP